MVNIYVTYTTVIMLLGTIPVGIKIPVFKHFWLVRVLIYVLYELKIMYIIGILHIIYSELPL